MGKRRPEKMPRPRSAASKSTRQERRQAARNEAKAQRTVDTASSLTAVPSYSRPDVLALLVLGLLVVVCYLPAMLWGGFVWDDSIFTSSQTVQDWSGLWRLWSGDAYAWGDTEEGHYWPLVYTTFWLEHKLWGFDPTGYHIVNVLLHLANTLLVWHLVRRLAVPGAWVVAAVFAVHPVHVESVAWIIERKDVLSGLFYLATVLTWMRFVEQPTPRRYAGSLALYAAGLLSKSIVITLPVALLLWPWWQRGRVTSTDLLRLVPFGVIGLVVVLVDLSFYQAREPLSLGYSSAERTLIASRALWFYMGKLLWPTNLTLVYPLWDIRVDDLLAWGYLIAAVALAVALWCFRHQVGRGPLAGVLFFVVTLSPVLGFVDYGYMQFAFVADRFQYLAGIGVLAVVCGAAAHGVRRLSDLWQQGARVVAAMVIVVLGLLTWQQASIWRDNETLWRHVIAHNPHARDAHANLGRALDKQGRYTEAVDAYRIAIKQFPYIAKVHENMGKTLTKLDRFEEAEKHLRHAIAVRPQKPSTYLHLGFALHGQQRYDDAVNAYQIVIEQDPDIFKAHVNLGMVLNKLGRYQEAETHLLRAIEISPQNVEAFEHLANALMAQRKYDEVLQCLDQLLALDPTLEAARANRETLLETLEGNRQQ